MKILLSREIENYRNAVINAGGEIGTKDCDGLILCGGGDISPSFYNEENISSYDVDYNLDLYEFNLLKEFVNLKKPVLGICRGIQLINVFFKGTLCQDIKNHKGDNGDIYHDIIVNNREIQVNSYHHQAIKKLGDGLLITAKALDGTIEAIRHKTLPVYGVQFHPERMHNGNIFFQRFLNNSDIFIDF